MAMLLQLRRGGQGRGSGAGQSSGAAASSSTAAGGESRAPHVSRHPRGRRVPPAGPLAHLCCFTSSRLNSAFSLVEVEASSSSHLQRRRITHQASHHSKGAAAPLQRITHRWLPERLHKRRLGTSGPSARSAVPGAHAHTHTSTQAPAPAAGRLALYQRLRKHGHHVRLSVAPDAAPRVRAAEDQVCGGALRTVGRPLCCGWLWLLGGPWSRLAAARGPASCCLAGAGPTCWFSSTPLVTRCMSGAVMLPSLHARQRQAAQQLLPSARLWPGHRSGRPGPLRSKTRLTCAARIPARQRHRRGSPGAARTCGCARGAAAFRRGHHHMLRGPWRRARGGT